MDEPVRVVVGTVDGWDEAAAAAVLDDRERERADRLRQPRHRASYVVSHAALRHVLGAQLDVAPGDVGVVARPCLHCGADHGKPAVAGGGVEFNLSHSGPWFAVALHPTCRVGVDLQDRNPARAAALARRFFTDAEQALVQAAADGRAAAAFTRLWCRKEAVLKASGLGIPGGLGRFDVLADDVTDPAGQRWLVHDLALGGLAGAVAVEPAGQRVPVVVERLAPVAPR